MKANLVSGFASVALIAVFAGTAILTLWSDRNERDSRDESAEAQAMSALFTRASGEAQRAELFISLWNATGDPSYLARQYAVQQEFVGSLNEMSEADNREDREFGTWAQLHFGAMAHIFARLQEQPAPQFADVMQDYLREYRALFDSIQSGEIGDPSISANLIDPRGVTDPGMLTTNPVTTIMDIKTADRDSAARAAAASTAASERAISWIAPLLYCIGTVLAIALLAITIGFGRREARAAAENAQLRRLSTTDALTQLGNRRGFEEASKRLSDSPVGMPVSLIMMDLDEFKVVNDTFGHARGDAILTTFAALLSRIAPPGASRFRVGGDEFALLVHGLDGAAALNLAQRVRRSAAHDLGSGVTVTIGVAELNPLDRDASLLQQKADAALYEGKMRGRDVAVLYEQEVSATPVFAAAKLQAVRQLLDEGRIEAVFQPIWDIYSSSLFGYEGLSRPHADYGLSGPQEAFDIAEQFGHAADLDRLCRNHLLAAARELPATARLFLNLSPYSLTHHGFSPLALAQELEAAGIACDRVVLEITERSHVATEAIAEAVEALREQGFRVALDDVGAGNNGLEILRKVPVDFVKIDRAVIRAASADGMGRAALMAILAFASESGAVVVAEGIEDAQMLTIVRDIASQTSLKGNPGLIHGVQGFLFGMPLAAAQTARELPPSLAA